MRIYCVILTTVALGSVDMPSVMTMTRSSAPGRSPRAAVNAEVRMKSRPSLVYVPLSGDFFINTV